MAEYKYSSTMGLKRCISSINKTSRASKLVSKPARSPGLSKTGPEVTLIPTLSSFAKICAKVVLPSPGGPWKSVWSNASSLSTAALTKIWRFSSTCSWPKKSTKVNGLKAFSMSCSSEEKFSSVGSRYSFIITNIKKKPFALGKGFLKL